MSVEKLYQLTILEYNNRKDLQKNIDNPTNIERGHNPSCGDDISLVLKIEDDKIKEASFIGKGCAISTASSAMLVELIEGKDIKFCEKIIDVFFRMMKNEEVSKEEKELLGDAILLEITKDMPARIKCSTLTWHSLKVILEGRK